MGTTEHCSVRWLVILIRGLLILLPNLVLSLGKSSEIKEYETAYACEETRLNISCEIGLHINVIRANYGRFSIAICNEHGNTDWSVNCMSPRTSRVIRARCQGSDTCDVPVDSTIFGDPCAGTFKYVEVHYLCEYEITTSTTSRPRPPWFPENPPNSWTDIGKGMDNQTASTSNSNTRKQFNEAEMTTSTDLDTEDIEDESILEGTKPKIIKVKVPKPINNEHRKQDNDKTYPFKKNVSYIDEEQPIQVEKENHDHIVPYHIGSIDYSESLLSMTNFTQFCPPTNARGLFWNWTAVGDTAVLQCPNDSTGFAKWRCGPLLTSVDYDDTSVTWASISPSLAECQSKWLNNLDSRLRDGEAIIRISDDLAQLSGLQAMYGGDLQLSTRMLKHMAERMHYDIQGPIDVEQRESMVTELVQNVALTGSNILDKINHMSWADLSHDDVAAAATSLMIGLEENAFLLADAVTTEKIIIKPTTNILLSIRVMQARTTQNQKFPTVEHLEMWDNQEDSIELTAKALQENSENGAVRIIFASFNEFDQLLIPSQRPNATLRFVNSRVVSAAIGKGRHVKLKEPVKITLKHLKTENVSKPICVFWDYSMQTWSDHGCHMIETNQTHTKCECDHLTNFALIMEEGESLFVASPLGSIYPHLTTIIACISTLICVTLMMFAIVITWRKFRVSHQCRSMLQNSGIPCFHKTKELSEKDKKQGNFYTVTPKLNGTVTAESNKPDANIELDSQQYFEHMIAMHKNQDSLVSNKTMNRKSNPQNSNLNEAMQETNLSESDPSKTSNLDENNTNNLSNMNHALNNTKNLKAKTQCQHILPNGYPLGMHNELSQQRKNNMSRAMSPYNHIYMEIDPKSEEGTVYEALNQSEASRSETYMLSSVSDMSDDDFRRCSDVSRQSSSRYAENKPLIKSQQGSNNFNMERNLLTTISGIAHSQSMRVANPQHHHRTSILSTISGLRYIDPSQPGQPGLLPVPISNTIPEAPVQVTTTVNGDQFVCLNLNNQDGDHNGNKPLNFVANSDINQGGFTILSDTGYSQSPDVTGLVPMTNLQHMQQGSMQMGVVQAPVHSQMIIQRVGTLPRQYAHPLAPLM